MFKNKVCDSLMCAMSRIPNYFFFWPCPEFRREFNSAQPLAHSSEGQTVEFGTEVEITKLDFLSVNYLQLTDLTYVFKKGPEID